MKSSLAAFVPKIAVTTLLLLLLYPPTKVLAQACPNGGITNPMLNLQVVCGSETAEIQDFGAKIINWGTTPVTLSDLSIGVWVYESGVDTFDQWNVDTGSICDASSNCTQVTLPNASGAISAYPTCMVVPGHYANQMVTFNPGTAASPVSLIPPNGGYFVTNSGGGTPGADLRFGRNNPQMDSGNWADDYSHLGTGLIPPG